MIYVLLLLAGLIVSSAHVYLVVRNKDGVRYSVSEHAIADHKSYLIYVTAHIITDILFIIYAYVFFYQIHGQNLLFCMTVLFIVFDAMQSILPSKNKTESLHFAFAYVSWFAYQLVGILSIFFLEIAQPYMIISIATLLPVLAMFAYMHFKREKLWPYQLLMVPLYVVFLLLITAGSM